MKTFQNPKKEESEYIPSEGHEELIQKEAPKIALKHQKRQLKKLFSLQLMIIITEISNSSQRALRREALGRKHLNPDLVYF